METLGRFIYRKLECLCEAQAVRVLKHQHVDLACWNKGRLSHECNLREVECL